MTREPTFRAGERLGPYELVRELGRGGFASVWLARRSGPGGFEARFAVKVIRSDVESDPAFQKMLIDEARLVAEVSHPNVVKIFELGEEGDVLYLVMEHVSGRPLDVLRNRSERAKRPIPVGVVMRILADTCAGLHAAHEVTRAGKPLGVIHRDVSPQNILVSDAGAIKLIDFGVAKANDRLAADTTEGHTKGKLRYMAPEQAMAKEIDRRADVWSVGAVAYDLLEGHAPYDGYNDLVRLFKLLDTTPPAPFTKGVPEPIARVIFKALARQPDDRYATAAEMRTAIESALDECGMRVGPEAIADHFRDWLGSEDDVASGGDGPELRARLARRSVHGRSDMATEDVPPPVETLGAINTEAGIVPVRSRRPLYAGAIAVGAIVLVGAVWRLGSGPRPTSAPAPSVDVPPAAAPIASAEPPAPDDSAVSSSTPTPRPMGSHGKRSSPPRTVKVAPTPAPTPSPPTKRPRYDDTIQ